MPMLNENASCEIVEYWPPHLVCNNFYVQFHLIKFASPIVYLQLISNFIRHSRFYSHDFRNERNEKKKSSLYCRRRNKIKNIFQIVVSLRHSYQSCWGSLTTESVRERTMNCVLSLRKEVAPKLFYAYFTNVIFKSFFLLFCFPPFILYLFYKHNAKFRTLFATFIPIRIKHIIFHERFKHSKNCLTPTIYEHFFADIHFFFIVGRIFFFFANRKKSDEEVVEIKKHKKVMTLKSFLLHSHWAASYWHSGISSHSKQCWRPTSIDDYALLAHSWNLFITF